MRFITALTIALAVIFLMTNCERQQKIKPFYPIDRVVTDQIVALAKAKTTLKKEARIGNHNEHVELNPRDTTMWVDELDIFRQLKAINKPLNQKSYIVDDGLFDPGSNLTVKAFTCTEDEDLPVRWLRIYYEDSIQTPRRIEAEYQEKNLFYQSSRLLLLEFQQVNNKTMLTSYSIEGGQKMIMEDSVVFSVRGKILIN